MDPNSLDITVISASHLKNVNYFMKMDVYVVVSLISGNSIIKHKTQVSHGTRNPRWSHTIKFSIQESMIQNNTLLFILYSRRILGDRIIGEVMIPVHELLENVSGSETKEHVVEYQVRSVRGRSRGSLTFSHKLKEKITLQNKNDNNKNDNNNNNNNNNAMQCEGESCSYRPPAPQGYNGYAHAGKPEYDGGHGPQPSRYP